MTDEVPMPGDRVRVRAVGGELVRTVVEFRPAAGGLPAVVCLSTDAELQAAADEDRDPVTVGFRMEFVLEVIRD